MPQAVAPPRPVSVPAAAAGPGGVAKKATEVVAAVAPVAPKAPAAPVVGPRPMASQPAGVPGEAVGRVARTRGIGQPIAMPAPGGAPPASLAARRRGSRVWSTLFFLVLLLAGGAAAYFYWTQNRETRLVCQPMVEGYRLSETAYLTNPLVAEIERLHQRYKEQLEPLRQEQAKREQAAAVAEKAAKEAEAPVAAAKQALAALELKHKQELAGVNAQTQDQFEARSKALEAELANTRQNFQRAMADRAKRINIEFAEDPEETEPDIVVSRFRTGLYGAGVGVDRKAEQAWAEEQLAQWRGYFDFWKSQRAALQEQFQATRGQFGQVLDRQKAELEKARGAIAKAEEQLRVAQAAAEAARQAMAAAGFDPKSIEAELVAQMDALPEKFKLAESAARADGGYVFSQLEFNPNTPPGVYVVFFRLWKDDKEYWAFGQAEVGRMQATTIRVFPESLLDKRRMLVEGKFEAE